MPTPTLHLHPARADDVLITSIWLIARPLSQGRGMKNTGRYLYAQSVAGCTALHAGLCAPQCRICCCFVVQHVMAGQGRWVPALPATPAVCLRQPRQTVTRAPTPPRHSVRWWDGTNSRGHFVPGSQTRCVAALWPLRPISRHLNLQMPSGFPPACWITCSRPLLTLPHLQCFCSTHTGGAVRPRGYPDDVPGH